MKARRRSPTRRSTLGTGKVPSISRLALLDQGADHRFRQLIQDTLAVSSRFHSIREELGKISGLSGPQYSLIVAISHLTEFHGGTTVSQLARHLHVSGTYVTAEANKLEDAGLLLRAPHPKDKRSVLLKMTKNGLELLDKLMPVIRRINDEIYRDLTRAEFESLVRIMENIAQSAGDALVLAEGYRRMGLGKRSSSVKKG